MSDNRAPCELRPARLGPLARLPVFLALETKRAVLAGGSQAAAWKAELLSASGARVEVYAASFCEEMLALATETSHIALNQRSWNADDLKDAAVGVGAFEDDADAAPLPMPPAPPACRSMSSTSRPSAISPSAPSSTARRW